MGEGRAVIAERRIRAIIAAAMLIVLGAGGASGEDVPTRADIWSLKLGTPVSALPRDAFVDYACGSNGGPPQQALRGWSDYDKCPLEPNGLHEVYFRYDDELEYWAKAHRARTLVAQYAGTKVLDFPVILSGLFDTGGTLAGLRIVTDPQANPQDRKQAYTLTNFFKARYGSEGWECIDTPSTPGETPVGTLYINQRCTKLVKGDTRAVLETRFLRKSGQAEFSGSGKLTVGQFESSTRLELLRPDVPVE
ncbi:MAG: hypothetical protein JOZ11_02240 [Alphaproteobacteria bacterium]|nr:hypothetical protein [Alphaproteobacteria bacterium]